MGKEETFDSFYRSTGRALLHQAFALTGDLTAAQGAVREGYVAAWHHWRKVSRLQNPEDWVRPRTWRLAQHRHNARIWHRNKGIGEDDKRILAGLSKLSSMHRRTLLLVALAAVPLPQAARELGLTEEQAKRHLDAATGQLAGQLEVDPGAIGDHLERLAGAVGGINLPRPSIVRRAGRKRRQLHTLAGTVAATAVAVASGAFAYTPAVGPTADRALDLSIPGLDSAASGPKLPTAGNLLDADQISRLGKGQVWRVQRTDNNTSGDGINTVCQRQRFADPKGLSALVRTFQAAGKPPRSAVQTVEISRTAAQARAAFATTVGWYAGCQAGRLQVLDAYQVGNVGDEATVLMIRVWHGPVTTLSVGVARTGAVTTSTVGTTVGGAPPPPAQIVQSLADAVSMLCARSGSRNCAKQPAFHEVPPPPTGRQRGVLAVGDLPPVGRIDFPWVATAPMPVTRNPAATTCDRADFAKAGAAHPMSRTYLIPQAKLPAQFGLSETYAAFPSSASAVRFLAGVRSSVAGCQHRDLATKVTGAHTEQDAHGGDLSTWDLATAVTDHQTVRFRVGFVRVGSRVAQLTFASAPSDDMSETSFHDLVVRAGDRLRELG